MRCSELTLDSGLASMNARQHFCQERIARIREEQAKVNES